MWRSLYRAYGSSAKSAAQSPLAALRRRTGFPLNKCRQALDSCKDNIDEAEKWLRVKAAEEGWQKTESLSGRAAKQGLIGSGIVGRRALALEVNCETDFVGRTEDFKDLVSVLTSGVVRMADSCDPKEFESQFQSELGKIGPIGNYKSVQDAIASTVGMVSENIVLSQGHLLSAREEEEEGMLSSFVYDNVLKSPDVGAGKYVCLLHLKRNADCSLSSSDVNQIASRIGQHIVGVHPKLIRENGNRTGNGTAILYNQPFLFDSNLTVGELLAREKMAVTSFVRIGPSESTSDVNSDHCSYFSVRL